MKRIEETAEFVEIMTIEEAHKRYGRLWMQNAATEIKPFFRPFLRKKSFANKFFTFGKNLD